MEVDFRIRKYLSNYKKKYKDILNYYNECIKIYNDLDFNINGIKSNEILKFIINKYKNLINKDLQQINKIYDILNKKKYLHLPIKLLEDINYINHLLKDIDDMINDIYKEDSERNKQIKEKENKQNIENNKIESVNIEDLNRINGYIL